MKRRLAIVTASLVLSVGLLATAYLKGNAADPVARSLITQPINDNALVTLAGNTRAEANAINDRGAVAANFAMPHLMLQLRRPPERQQALDRYLEQLSDRNSPNYHHWLSAEEVGTRYGLASGDLTKLTNWLQAYGFTINAVEPNRAVIDFSGTAGTVSAAFHTEIHQLDVNGVMHTANMSDPQVPAALAPAIVGIVSLNDFRPRPMYQPRANYTIGGGLFALVPADLATIYNLNPIFAAGDSGQGETIVVIEDTDVFSTTDWNTFRSTFGLASAYPDGSFTQIHPTASGNACTDPGVNSDDGEAILDAEWSSAAAPNAAIELASCANTATFGGFIALQNLLNGSSLPPIVSISYGESEPDLLAAGNAFINSLYQQAVMEGVSVFVSSGDSAAAGSDDHQATASHGITVSGFATTPFDVAVGGTDYSDTFSSTTGTYWGTNGANFGSALSYIPEIPWNDSCASVLIASFEGFGTTYGAAGFCSSVPGANFINTVGGSGGPSGCATGAPSSAGVVGGTCAGYAKPSWQAVFGNPSDGVRDVPDVSLFAANGVWGHYYVYCYSDLTFGGASCSGAPSTWSGAGGTSFAAPIMAGIQALADQKAGGPQGNPNPVYYQLADTEYGASGDSGCDSTLGAGTDNSCIFYDVTQGDMDVPCSGTNNCFKPSGVFGVLSTSDAAYQLAYGTGPGWDFATGIGTVNATNLVNAFSSSGATPTPTPSASATPTPTPSVSGTPTPSPTPTGGPTPTPTPTLTPTPTPTPTPAVTTTLTGSPATLNFKNVDATASSKTKKVTLNNEGTNAATLGQIVPPASFSISNDTCSNAALAVEQKCTLDVAFSPATPVSVNENLTIPYNGTSPTISLSGTGLAVTLKAPKSVTLPSTTAGSTGKTKNITLKNKSGAAVTLGTVALTGDFTITSDLCTNAVLAAKSGKCVVTMEFAPTSSSSGTLTGTLSYPFTYGTNSGTVMVPLTGKVKS